MNKNTTTARQVLENAKSHSGASLRVYTLPDNKTALQDALVVEAGNRQDVLSRVEVVAYRTPEERKRAAQAHEPKKQAES